MAKKTAADYKRILEGLKSQSKGGGKFDYMDLVEGPNVVRVLPGHPNMEGFFTEIFQHQKGQGKTYMSVICLNHGDPRADECLIDPDLEELKLSNDKKDKKLYNSMKPKPRYYMNVVERKTNTVKTLPCGSQILQGVLTYVTDEEYGDVLDVNEGRDLIIEKSGEGMDTEYTVKPKVKTSPLFADEDQITELIGTSAEDTKLPDLSEMRKQFEDEPEKAKLVWDQGWDALKESDEDDDKKSSKKPSGKKKPAAEVEEVEEEEAEETVDITTYPKLKARDPLTGDVRYKTPNGPMTADGRKSPKGLEEGQRPSKPSKAYLKEFPEPEPEPEETPVRLKSRCSTCGAKRFKTSAGVSCDNGHSGVPALADGARPSKPCKEYLKEFPAPVEEEEEEEVEEAPAKPAKGAPAGKKPAATTVADDDEEGLDDLDAILAQHSKKGK